MNVAPHYKAAHYDSLSISSFNELIYGLHNVKVHCTEKRNTIPS